jgi:flagellar assembly protein FliH
LSSEPFERLGPDVTGSGHPLLPAGAAQRRFLRDVHLAPPITLGLDGRPREAGDPLSGLVGGTPEETEEAGAIVDAAQRHAHELLRAATLDATSIRERAREAGYESGYRDGSREARAALAEALALVQQVAAEGVAIRNDLLRRSEREMVEMVIAALRSILGDRAAGGPEIAVHTVRHALERAGAQNVVRVRVHPDQVQPVLAALAEDASQPPAFEVAGDGAVGIGGCIVDTTHGRVDARLDVQLDAIARLLHDALPVEAEDDPFAGGVADAA